MPFVDAKLPQGTFRGYQTSLFWRCAPRANGSEKFVLKCVILPPAQRMPAGRLKIPRLPSGSIRVPVISFSLHSRTLEHRTVCYLCRSSIVASVVWILRTYYGNPKCCVKRCDLECLPVLFFFSRTYLRPASCICSGDFGRFDTGQLTKWGMHVFIATLILVGTSLVDERSTYPKVLL